MVSSSSTTVSSSTSSSNASVSANPNVKLSAPVITKSSAGCAVLDGLTSTSASMSTPDSLNEKRPTGIDTIRAEPASFVSGTVSDNGASPSESGKKPTMFSGGSSSTIITADEARPIEPSPLRTDRTNSSSGSANASSVIGYVIVTEDWPAATVISWTGAPATSEASAFLNAGAMTSARTRNVRSLSDGVTVAVVVSPVSSRTTSATRSRQISDAHPTKPASAGEVTAIAVAANASSTAARPRHRRCTRPPIPTASTVEPTATAANPCAHGFSGWRDQPSRTVRASSTRLLSCSFR